MSCKHQAVVIVTRTVAGTASNVAKRRIDLFCRQPAGHVGEHYDPEQDRRWTDKGPELTHILEHEDEPADPLTPDSTD
jgi:hypothetical protein